MARYLDLRKGDAPEWESQNIPEALNRMGDTVFRAWKRDIDYTEKNSKSCIESLGIASRSLHYFAQAMTLCAIGMVYKKSARAVKKLKGETKRTRVTDSELREHNERSYR